MIIISYKTLIIIEKNDFDEKAPTLISKFLHEHECSDKSAPLNTYIGLENQSVLEWESEKDGADKLKQIPYGKFNRTRGLDNTSITFFNNLTQRKTLAFVSWLKEKK